MPTSPLPFTIDVGQFWKRDGEVWYVPRVEKDLPSLYRPARLQAIITAFPTPWVQTLRKEQSIKPSEKRPKVRHVGNYTVSGQKNTGRENSNPRLRLAGPI